MYEEDQILNWLMTQKDPGGDVIEDLEGQRLIDLIEESGSMAVYFCKWFIVNETHIYLAAFINNFICNWRLISKKLTLLNLYMKN